MELGISYDCAIDRIISLYETYHVFSTSMVRYKYFLKICFKPVLTCKFERHYFERAGTNRIGRIYK